MKKYQKLFLASAFALTTIPAYAAPLSWSYINVNYNLETVELNNVTDDLEGSTISFGGSYSPIENFAVIGGYSTGSADVSGNGNTVDLDLDGYYIGGLAYTPVSPSADFFAGVRFVEVSGDYSVNGVRKGTLDGDGTSLFLGIRALVNPKLELNAMIDRFDGGNDTSTDIKFGAGYYIATDVSLTASYAFSSDATSLSFGATKHF